MEQEELGKLSDELSRIDKYITLDIDKWEEGMVTLLRRYDMHFTW